MSINEVDYTKTINYYYLLLLLSTTTTIYYYYSLLTIYYYYYYYLLLLPTIVLLLLLLLLPILTTTYYPSFLLLSFIFTTTTTLLLLLLYIIITTYFCQLTSYLSSLHFFPIILLSIASLYYFAAIPIYHNFYLPLPLLFTVLPLYLITTLSYPSISFPNYLTPINLLHNLTYPYKNSTRTIVPVPTPLIKIIYIIIILIFLFHIISINPEKYYNFFRHLM